MTDKAATPKIADKQIAKLKAFTTKSAQIRYLDSEGYTRGDISRILTKFYGKLVRYQHVRNVLITPLVGKK